MQLLQGRLAALRFLPLVLLRRVYLLQPRLLGYGLQEQYPLFLLRFLGFPLPRWFPILLAVAHRWYLQQRSLLHRVRLPCPIQGHEPWAARPRILVLVD